MKNNFKYNKFNQPSEHISWTGISLTNSATKYILQLLNNDPHMLGLKITIQKSGCAGLTYKVDKVYSPEKKCFVYNTGTIKLFIPIDFMPLIDGTELDYVQEGLSYSLKFKNPKAQYSCGCGESFNI